MTMFPKKRKRPRLNEPRPQCPECGFVVQPETAVIWRLPPRSERESIDLACIGVYCRADCLLDAHRRGWPHWRVKGQGS